MFFVLSRVLFVAMLAMPSTALADQAFKICYRTDAAPFSYLDGNGTPAGYTVDICNLVARDLNLRPEMVAVTSESRFDFLQEGRCDVLCGATTVTMVRRQSVEFSLITFLTSSALLYPRSLQDKQGSARIVTVGYLRGTTIEDHHSAGTLTGGDRENFKFVAYGSHGEAKAALRNGALDGYVADREILEHILLSIDGLAETHRISGSSITYEPYAIAVRMGDDERRIAIDRVLADLFRSHEINDILAEHVPTRRDDEFLSRLFTIQALPQ